MAENSNIQWTHHTFNPWIGCSKVHAGCTNYYAEADMDKRRGRVQWGPHGTRSKTSDANWREPLKWNRANAATWECPECGFVTNNAGTCPNDGRILAAARARVFCASLADVFEDWDGPIVDHRGHELWYSPAEPQRLVPASVPFEELTPGEQENFRNGLYVKLTMSDLRRDLFRLIDATPHLDWILLTKRPENVLRMWPMTPGIPTHLAGVDHATVSNPREYMLRPNVWLLCSVSNQETADRMIPDLLECRGICPILGVSAEPLLGPIELSVFMLSQLDFKWADKDGPTRIERKPGTAWLDWVIFGGESGPHARPCDIAWIHDGVRQCRESGVPAFVKQLGSFAVTQNVNMHDFSDDQQFDCDAYGHGTAAGARILFQHPKGGDPSEWPEDLRVREVPANGVVQA